MGLYINDMPVNVTIFPDKTSQVWKLHEPLLNIGEVTIQWSFVNESEVMHLAQLRDLLRAYGNPLVTLHVDYLPYARQDKRIHNNSTFALRTFARLINAMEFEEVRCFDPHSEVAGQLIRNFKAFYPTGKILEIFTQTKSTLVCYPDKGAFAKYAPYLDLPWIVGAKVRNQETGEITHYEIGPTSVKGENILIVDDICDGGATFILLAKKLYDAGASDVNLFVSHGIFSKGKDILLAANIKKIITGV